MKSAFTTRIGSELFETSVIKTEEAFLYIKSATMAGTDLETAYDDMRTIDDLLHLKNLHNAVRAHIRYTRSGNLKKDSSWYDAMNDLLDARIIQDTFEKQNAQ
jgi:hypothetical protein